MFVEPEFIWSKSFAIKQYRRSIKLVHKTVFFGVCVCMLCAGMCMHASTCVHICLEAVVISRYQLPWFIRPSLTGLEVISLARLLTNEFQGLSSLHLSRPGTISTHHHSWLFDTGSGDELRSYLQGKDLMDSAIPLSLSQGVWRQFSRVLQPRFLFIKLSHFFILFSLGHTLKTSPVWLTYYVSVMVAPKQVQDSRRQYSGWQSCPCLSIRPRGGRKMFSSQPDFLQPWGQAHRRHSGREAAGLKTKHAWKETKWTCQPGMHNPVASIFNLIEK